MTLSLNLFLEFQTIRARRITAGPLTATRRAMVSNHDFLTQAMDSEDDFLTRTMIIEYLIEMPLSFSHGVDGAFSDCHEG